MNASIPGFDCNIHGVIHPVISVRNICGCVSAFVALCAHKSDWGGREGERGLQALNDATVELFAVKLVALDSAERAATAEAMLSVVAVRHPNLVRYARDHDSAHQTRPTLRALRNQEKTQEKSSNSIDLARAQEEARTKARDQCKQENPTARTGLRTHRKERAFLSLMLQMLSNTCTAANFSSDDSASS
jgi:hypothetical protein